MFVDGNDKLSTMLCRFTLRIWCILGARSRWVTMPIPLTFTTLIGCLSPAWERLEAWVTSYRLMGCMDVGLVSMLEKVVHPSKVLNQSELSRPWLWAHSLTFTLIVESQNQDYGRLSSCYMITLFVQMLDDWIVSRRCHVIYLLPLHQNLLHIILVHSKLLSLVHPPKLSIGYVLQVSLYLRYCC